MRHRRSALGVFALGLAFACSGDPSPQSPADGGTDGSLTESTGTSSTGGGLGDSQTQGDSGDGATASGGEESADGSGATAGATACPNLLQDGGFEGGTASEAWLTDSILFPTPLCNSVCLDGASSGPYAGAWWLWFGGQPEGESAHASQSVRVPEGEASLSFYLQIPTAAGTGDDILAVTVDGRSRIWISDLDATDYASYTQVTLDLPELADGGLHEIGFAANFPGTGVTSFFVDTVALSPCAVSR